MTRRTDKVSSLFHREVGNFLQSLELPSLTTISKVEITPDLKWCKVFITIMGTDIEKKAVMKILLKNRIQMQDQITKDVEMKMVPRVRFVIDRGEEYAAHINKLLRSAQQD